MNSLKLLLIFLFPLLISAPAEAKEYTIPEIQIEVQINADGSLRITEHRSYVFEGSYSWANYRLPKEGFDSITDIRVSEKGMDFYNENDESSGSFSVSESSGAYDIRWYFNAEDERRTFSLSYTLTGAIITGREWSEFFWNYAAAGRERSQQKITILIRLPEQVDRADLYWWLRSPLAGFDAMIMDNGYRFEGRDISRNQSVRIRTIFPTSVFDADRISYDGTAYTPEEAEREEVQIREQREQQIILNAQKKETGIQLAILLALLSLAGYIFFYRKYGARFKVHERSTEMLMAPGRQKPSAIAWLLMDRNVSGNQVTATLLDMARQGYFVIKEQEPEEEKKWYNDPKPYFTIRVEDKEIDPRLTEWEEDLIRFVRKRVRSEGPKMEDIFKYSEREVYKWFGEWKKTLSSYARSQGWVDPESFKGAVQNAVLQGLILISAAVCIFLIHPLAGLSMIASFLFMVLSLTIIRRTQKGEELYKDWSNYRKALKKAKEHSLKEDLMDMHFIHAIAFGLTKDEIEELCETYPEQLALIYWLVILPGSSSSPASIASSFSNMAASGTVSAGGGVGGGASAGSAGGGASGGAG